MTGRTLWSWRMSSVVCLLVVGLLVLGCSEETVAPEEDLPTATYGFQLYSFGTEFYGIWMFSATDWIGVGADGLIVVYHNGDFYSVDSGVLNHFRDIWASGPDDIFVVGDAIAAGGGIIMHFDGSTWSTMTHPATDNIVAVSGLTSTNVYAVSSAGEVLHYDGSWNLVYDFIGDRSLADIWCAGLTNIIAVGANGGIARWDGGSWSDDSVLGDDFTGVWGTAYNNIYVCGGEQIWRYDGSWHVAEQAAGWQLEKIHGSGPNDVWAVGPDNNVVHWDGSSFAEVAVGSQNDFHAVWSQAADNTWLLSDHGGVYRKDASGWNEINNSMQGGWVDMSGVSANSIYAVSGKTLMYWNGTAWTEESTGPGYNTALWCLAQNDVRTCGWPGSGAPRYVYNYNGAWSPEFSIDWTMPWGVWGADANHIFVVWDDRIISWYDGVSWSQEQLNVLLVPVTFRDVWGVSAVDVFVVGDGGTAVRLVGATRAVMNTNVSASIDLGAVWGTSASDVVAVGEAGTIIRFDGTDWNTENSGVSTILTDVWGDAPDNYWVVGMSGVVLHNNGTGWKKLTSSVNREIGLNCVWGSGGNNVWVGGDNDYLLHWEKR